MRFSFPDIDVSDTYTYIHTCMYVCMPTTMAIYCFILVSLVKFF